MRLQTQKRDYSPGGHGPGSTERYLRRTDLCRAELWHCLTVGRLCSMGHFVRQRKACRFKPSDGFLVYIGKWERTEGTPTIQATYRFALGEKLDCGVWAKSYEDGYGVPATAATWSATTNPCGQFTVIETPSHVWVGHHKYVPLLRLENPRELVQTIAFAEKTLSERASSR